MSEIVVQLADEKKWKEFHPNTEMIVTKKRGRVIFPHLDYLVKGLDAKSLYTMHIHLERVDNKKYKFDGGEWQEAAKGDRILPIQFMEHSDGARTGAHWMSGNVSFASLKITNDPKNENPKLILVQSMHKYQPVLTITRLGDRRGEQFRLKLTEFIVVTAYQNEEVIKLKVAHNKFASGFRSNGKRRNSDESENQDPKRRSPSDCSSSSSSPPIHGPQMPLATSSFYQNPIVNPFGDFPTNNVAWNPYYQNQWYYQNQQNFMNMNMNMWNMAPPPTDGNVNPYFNL